MSKKKFILRSLAVTLAFLIIYGISYYILLNDKELNVAKQVEVILNEARSNQSVEKEYVDRLVNIGPEAVKPLINSLHSRDEVVVYTSTEAIRRLCDESIVSDLLDVYNKECGHISAIHIVNTIASYGDKALPIVVQELSSKNEISRYNAVQIISRFSTDHTLGILQQHFKVEKNESVKMHIVMKIYNCLDDEDKKEKYFEFANKCLNSSDSSVKWIANLFFKEIYKQ